jgi:TrmH family RNA methyltransferase
VIKSRQNDFYKQLKSYQLAKYRKRDNCLVAEGDKLYREAASTLPLRYTVVSESYLAAHPQLLDEHSSLAEAGLEQGRLSIFANDLFESVSELKTSQGILGVFEQPTAVIDVADQQRVLMLEDMQDPKNLGSIVRSAHALGYGAVFLAGACASPFSPKAIRASMGSVFHVPLLSVDLQQQISELKAADFTIVGTALNGDADARKTDKLALLIGNEGSGLSAGAQELCDNLFTIPMHNKAESLNAAVASGIAMYIFNSA